MAKALVEHTPAIDIRELRRDGHITPGQRAISFRTPSGQNDGASISFIPCHLGGARPVFHCPDCHRRAFVLYAAPHLACRKCHDLAYASENEGAMDRRLRKAIKWRARLGQISGGIAVPFPSKPKWLRWHTYLRLMHKGLALEQAQCAVMAARLGLRLPD